MRTHFMKHENDALNTLFITWDQLSVALVNNSSVTDIPSKATNQKPNLKYLICASNQSATTARMFLIRGQSENAFIPVLPLVRNDRIETEEVNKG